MTAQKFVEAINTAFEEQIASVITKEPKDYIGCVLLQFESDEDEGEQYLNYIGETLNIDVEECEDIEEEECDDSYTEILIPAHYFN